MLAGHKLLFFPEGTFQAEPGLMRFRTGAFAAAARRVMERINAERDDIELMMAGTLR